MGRPLEGAHLRHRDYLLWSGLVSEVERAVESGDDLECDEFGPLARGSGRLIVDRRFVEAACPACGRSYTAGDCEIAEWSSVAWPRAGIGGMRFTCPAGHTLYVHQTWVA